MQAQVSAFVKKTEFRMIKDLDDFGLDEYTNISVSSGNAGTVSLNDRVRIVRNVNFKVSTGTTVTNLTSKNNMSMQMIIGLLVHQQVHPDTIQEKIIQVLR